MEMGEKFSRNSDTNILFKGYRNDGADKKIKDIAMRCHEGRPWVGILSWDLSIDEDEGIVLIEINTSGQSAWFLQMVNGESLLVKILIRFLNLSSDDMVLGVDLSMVIYLGN